HLFPDVSRFPHGEGRLARSGPNRPATESSALRGISPLGPVLARPLTPQILLADLTVAVPIQTGEVLQRHSAELLQADPAVAIAIQPAVHPFGPLPLQPLVQLLRAQHTVAVSVHALETLRLKLLELGLGHHAVAVAVEQIEPARILRTARRGLARLRQGGAGTDRHNQHGSNDLLLHDRSPFLHSRPLWPTTPNVVADWEANVGEA